jgi:cytochrome c556
MNLRQTAALFAFACGLSVAGLAVAQDPIAARKEGFKGAKEAMGKIKDTLEAGGDLAVVKVNAEKLVGVAHASGALFPAGSDKGDTKAKASIWSNMDDFKAKGAAFATESAKLVAVAATGDAGAVKKQFGATGATCKACHESYKAD